MARVQAGSAVRVLALLCAIYVAQSARRAVAASSDDGTPTSGVVKRSADFEDKRGFRPDLGKRLEDDDDELRQSLDRRQQRSRGRFRGDLGKRLSSFRGDLGKRRRFDLGKRAAADDDDVDVDVGGRRLLAADKRPFRGDLGKRRASSFRGDLGKRDPFDDDSSTMWSDEDVGRSDFSKRRYGFLSLIHI